MTINQRHFFLRSVLTLTLLMGGANVQAVTGTTSVQSLVMLVGMVATQTPNENGDVDFDSLGISLAELFNLEVSIATGVKQTVAKAPSVASVITAKDIEATGATDLDEVLEMIPGLHVARSPYAYAPTYTIRGMYSSFNPQVLMLINGIPVTGLYVGNRGWVWAGMPVATIDRIEVIRGPGSAVYGADAFAGVINVITKTKESIAGTEIGSRMGNFKTGDVWALHGGNYQGFDVALALEYFTTDGHKEILESDGQTILDRVFGTEASLAPGPVNVQRDKSLDVRLDISRGHWQLRGGYQGRHDVGSGAVSGRSLDPSARNRDDRLNTDLTWHNPTLTDNWDVTAQASYYHTKYRTDNQLFFPPGAFGGAYPDGYHVDSSMGESHTRLNFSGFYSGFKKHLIRLGTGYYYGDLYEITILQNTNPNTGLPIPYLMDISDTIYTQLPEVARSNWHVFLQDMWSIAPNWELTLGLRYDEYSDFGSTTNPRGGLMWQPHPDITTKLLYGSAFRAPSANDLYMKSTFMLGNPDLDPETIKTWELAFDYRATSTLHFATNIYRYKWVDGITLAPDFREDVTGELLRIQNVNSQKGHGLELEMRWKMTAKSSLLANYAFVKATNEITNQDAGNYPQHSAYVRTDWLVYPNWYLDVQANWVGEMKRVGGDPRPPLDDYTIVDFTLRRKNINQDQWNFAVSVRNLFDADAHVPSDGPGATGDIDFPGDFPLAGRHYWLEMRYRF